MKYPQVHSEAQTLELAHMGYSIARYGDGELKIALGRDAKSQRRVVRLQEMLKTVLLAKDDRCLPCIPNVHSETPKFAFWGPFKEKPYIDLYNNRMVYGSSFVTRPDSAPWIDSDKYWNRVIDLWRDRDVVLVRGSSKSLTKADLHHAGNVHEIIAQRQHAFSDYDDLLALLRYEQKRRVLLCLGATATVLAYALSQLGVHALDLGHVGMFLRREGRFDRESFPK